MVEISEGSLEAAEKDGYEIPNDYRPDTLDSELAQNWIRLFGEELPTVYELMDKARESIQTARQFLTDNKN